MNRLSSLDDISYRNIHLLFARSPYGKILKSQVRFSPYKPENTTNLEWEKILGRDVNNLHHMPFTVRLTKDFILGCDNPHSQWKGKISDLARFKSSDKEHLILAAQIHDWAEARVGDIPAPLKTKEQEKEEIGILKEMVSELLGKRYKAIVPKAIFAIEAVMEKKVEKLGMAFDAIERLGYYKVALRAWRNRNKYEGDLRNSLYLLATAPTSPIQREREKLMYYSGIYPPIHQFFNSSANLKVVDQVLRAVNLHQ